MAQDKPTHSPKEIVRQFLLDVRSGRNPDNAKIYMADTITAHQVVSEDVVIVRRTPEQYANHVRETLQAFGNYSLEILELLGENEKVYARWKIVGKHVGEVDGYPPTSLPVTEIVSATYIVKEGKIQEYWIQIDRLGTEIQLKQNEGGNTIRYFQVDVFSDKPLSGNSLTVFPFAESYSPELMKKLTGEMRHFESIFLHKINDSTYRTRIFTMEEELDFAGHPVIGAAGVIHDLVKPQAAKASWIFSLNSKDVVVETEKTNQGFVGQMNQGTPTFGKALSKSETINFLRDLSLNVDDWDERFPLQVVSTGLPYLLIPVKQGHGLKSKITVKDLEKKLTRIGAKFVGIFEVDSRKIRTWDNFGTVEDIATGSLAGPVGAYLVKYNQAQPNQIITLFQGENLGRPSRLDVVFKTTTLNDGEIIVSGHVVKIANGKFHHSVNTILNE